MKSMGLYSFDVRSGFANAMPRHVLDVHLLTAKASKFPAACGGELQYVLRLLCPTISGTRNDNTGVM